MSIYDDFENCVGFDWDEGDKGKNWDKHNVSDGECEEIFFNDPLIARADPKHSKREYRYFVLGQTDTGRGLFVSCTVRKNHIRIISARDMTKKELRKYTQ